MPYLGINPGDPSQADAVYFPLRSQAVVRVGIKTAADAIGAATTLVRLTATLSPRPQVQWTQTLRDQLASPATIFRAIGAGLASLGAAALALACMGTYAIVAFSVAQRRREIAIRMALGARRRAVIAAVVGRNLRQLTGGALVGCVLSVGIREAIAVAPFAIERASLSMVGAMLGVVVLLGVAACAQPLYRALALNPASWLRN